MKYQQELFPDPNLQVVDTFLKKWMLLFLNEHNNSLYCCVLFEVGNAL